MQQITVQENMIESNQYFHFKRQPSIVMERQATAVMGTKRPLQFTFFVRPSVLDNGWLADRLSLL